jgi:NTP pyrophosphatase (non-canonical NTP hydrolase)
MFTNHSELVSALKKEPGHIHADLTAARIDIWHAGTGIVGEAGELIDAIKKHVIYNRELDIKNVVEEMGDIEFYMEQLRQALNITREETIQANLDKLNKRYAEGKFSDQQAQVRADKVQKAVDDATA